MWRGQGDLRLEPASGCRPSIAALVLDQRVSCSGVLLFTAAT
jgi:hypothetical protein